MGSQKRLISLLANEDNRQDVAKLEEPFLEEEVFISLLDLNGDKALRLDNFLIAF